MTRRNNNVDSNGSGGGGYVGSMTPWGPHAAT
ncbi:hypothetical protein M0804_008028 [Polistes exclamans]|nr:hypothetical protein M0804_008028 [Polistes exclamans]